MQSGSYWAYRSAAELPDYEQEAPDWKGLWDKQHVARRPHECSACGDEIAPGTKYRSIGGLMDGLFETSKFHLGQCPRFAEREKAELARQFEEDRERFFPSPASDGDQG
jgi:hypothetical protein